MFDELAGGVFRRRYRSLDLNVGVVVGEDGVLLVDTRASLRQARELSQELQGLTNLPVRWVVNTHWHWDHTFGNAEFRGAEIWGHQLTRLVMEERGEEMKEAAREWFDTSRREEIDEVVLVAPDHTFSDRVSLAIGREVLLTYHGRAHTDADIVVRVPGSDVAFFGDLVEEGAPPAFDDSHPLSWPSTLRAAAEQAPATVVPGHGDVVGPGFIATTEAELAAVAALASEVIAEELPMEEAVRRGPYPPETMRTALTRAETTSG